LKVNLMSFLEDYQKLIKSLPQPPRYSLSNENAPYVNSIHYIKNCYLCYDGGYAEDSAYCLFPYKITDCFDCDFTYESELCCECIDCQKCYNCGYCEECVLCRDCQFCFFCRDCRDCFGCVGLHHNKYCLFNKQYSKGGYFKKLKELKKKPVEKHLEKLEDLKRSYPRQRVHTLKSENTPYGNFITNCANSYWLFDSIGSQDCAYLYQSKFGRNSFDLDQSYECELCYECIAGGFCYNSSYLTNCTYCQNCHYCWHCDHCESCFGCANLQNAKYCFLNRQYKKGEYFKRVGEIRKEIGWPSDPQMPS